MNVQTSSMSQQDPSATPDPRIDARTRRGRLQMLMLLLVCASPVLFSYFTYYVIKPQTRNNYGDLIDPRAYPIPDLGSTSIDGKPASLAQFHGKWILLQVEIGRAHV